MLKREQLLNTCADPEERLALAKVLDLADDPRRKAYSDFLDPAKAGKFHELLSKRGINIHMFGGYASAERKMLGICPEYMELSDDDFPIDVLKLSYNNRFSRELTHRDFLGSIMGMGIDRSRVGDIVVNDDGARVFVCREISGYIIANLERVGAAKVKVEAGAPDEVSEPAGSELRLTVASLRLDAVISAAFRLSRSKAAGLIAGEKVFVNWAMTDSTSKLLAENDMITVRGLGRVRVMEIGGRTKKDRLAVKMEVWK